jgi:hypothetical protein
MTGFLVRRTAELLARDLAADDSHAMRPDNHYHAGRIGRGHLEEFVELEMPVSPDNPAAKIKDAADVRAHILSIAAHPETVALHVQDSWHPGNHLLDQVRCGPAMRLPAHERQNPRFLQLFLFQIPTDKHYKPIFTYVYSARTWTLRPETSGVGARLRMVDFFGRLGMSRLDFP